MPLIPSAKLGAQNAEVYSGWLGLSKPELEQLQREEVI